MFTKIIFKSATHCATCLLRACRCVWSWSGLQGASGLWTGDDVTAGALRQASNERGYVWCVSGLFTYTTMILAVCPGLCVVSLQ